MATVEDLKLERSYSAPPNVVFDAWTDPEIFPHWFGPNDCTIPEFELDVRVGGAWRAVMLGNETGMRHEVGGVYTDVSRPERLAFTWVWTQDDGTTGREYLVTVSLKPEGRGTRLTIVHSNFDDADARDKHGYGWSSTLDCLEKFLETAPAA